MKEFLVWCLVLFLAVGGLDAIGPFTPSENYPDFADANDFDTKLYRVYWKVDKDDVVFEVHAQSTGWIGLGISPNGGMDDSDIAIAWVDSNGKAHLMDTHAIGMSQPKVDSQSDLKLIDAKEADGYTMVKFRRKLNTCDKDGDLEIKSGSTRLIFAWNNQDPVGNNWLYHGANRYVRSAQIVKFQLEDVSNDLNDPDNVERNLTLNHPIPNIETYYYCKIFEMQPVETDMHMISYEIDIKRENIDIVHHFDVYLCDYDPTVDYSDYIKGQQCADSGSAQLSALQCQSLMLSWAVGGQKKVNLPNNVGFRFNKTSTPTYIMFNMHYNNPRLDSGRVDNSTTLRLIMTKKLRPNEMAVMGFSSGIYLNIQIPPKVEKLKVTTVCFSECTESRFPDDGITVFGGNLHTHMTGVAVRTSLVRNNTVVDYVFDDQKFDFNYQFTIMRKPIKLYKGDLFITECTYSSLNRDEMTFGGLGSRDEMCSNYLFYYPRIPNFRGCSSYFDKQELASFYQSLIDDKLVPEFKFDPNFDQETQDNIISFFKNNVTVDDTLRDRMMSFLANPKKQEAKCHRTVIGTKDFYKPQKYLQEVDTCKKPSLKNLIADKLEESSNQYHFY